MVSSRNLFYFHFLLSSCTTLGIGPYTHKTNDGFRQGAKVYAGDDTTPTPAYLCEAQKTGGTLCRPISNPELVDHTHLDGLELVVGGYFLRERQRTLEDDIQIRTPAGNVNFDRIKVQEGPEIRIQTMLLFNLTRYRIQGASLSAVTGFGYQGDFTFFTNQSDFTLKENGYELRTSGIDIFQVDVLRNGGVIPLGFKMQIGPVRFMPILEMYINNEGIYQQTSINLLFGNGK
ncbi:hypothetical protein HYV86_07010 [Candidatus Woesearchaeota archaeon]|nr:hypothetical protein [Candidatus Woesearchaeota archaeon]